MNKRKIKEEVKKCKDDIVYFMETYCLINKQPIVLRDYQKEFLKKYEEELNDEQLKAVVYAFAFTDKLKESAVFSPEILELIDKIPKKKHNINFTWNLQNTKYDERI